MTDKKQTEKARIAIFEGLPGSGKSKFIRSAEDWFLRMGKRVHIFHEDIDPEFLTAYLHAKQQYAFAFQSNLAVQRRYQWQRAIEIVNADKEAIVLLDRSRIGDYAFASNLAAQGMINEFDFKLYKNAAGLVGSQTLATMHPREVFHVIYLNVTSQTARERIRRRGNPSEIAFYTPKVMEEIRTHYEVAIDLCRSIVSDVNWNTDLDSEFVQKNTEGELLLPDNVLELILGSFK